MNNNEKIETMVQKKVWAVVGATPNSEKVANKIYHTLKEYGYETYVVNPKYEEMDDGSKIYARLEDLPKVPDCVDFVVPPTITMSNLKEMNPEVYPCVWLQPGTYDDEVVKYAEEKGFQVVHEGACVMAYLRMNKCSVK
jgi:predicted CoA-binding protein